MNEELVNFILTDTQAILKNVDLSELTGKSILITGASGMVGTYFLFSLINQSKLSSTPMKIYAVVHSQPEPYLANLASIYNIEFLSGDLTDQIFCQSLPLVDFIIHAAGYAQPGKFLADAVRTLKINTLTTFCLLEKLLPNGKFLFVSSSEIYSGLVGPHKETDVGVVGINHPRYCYIEGKRCGEAICDSYRGMGIEVKSARLSLAYGPGTKLGDKRAMPMFIEKAITKGSIDLMDEGKAVRTYCYVTDVVVMMWNVLLRGKQPLYNVGGVSKINIAELAQKIGVILKTPVIIPSGSGEALVGSPQDVTLDMSLYTNEFGKINYFSFEEGLNKTIDWIKILNNKV